MTDPTESVIVCEGYFDRAFWTGWLVHLGCTDPGTMVPDPWKDMVAGRGQRAYYSASEGFVRLIPAGGKREVIRAAHIRLEQAKAKRLVRLVMNVDSDVIADGTPNPECVVSHQSVRDLVRQFDPRAVETDEGHFLLNEGATEVCVVRWEAGDAPDDQLPNQQTLERLVCAALVAAYPKRASAVHRWLRARPDAPGAGPKEFAWSHMAGWYAEGGCEFFYERVWQVDQVRRELESRLRDSGAWAVAARLAG